MPIKSKEERAAYDRAYRAKNADRKAADKAAQAQTAKQQEQLI